MLIAPNTSLKSMAIEPLHWFEVFDVGLLGFFFKFSTMTY